MEDKNRVSLKIDLRSGVIEIDAPAANFQEAIAQTKNLAESLDFSAAIEAAAASTPPPKNEPPPTSEQAPKSAPSTKQSTTKKSRASGASSARPGRIGSFEEVRGLLTEPQEIELREFFTAKSPTEQAHQVLVAVVKGEELLGRRGFSYNEIYTLMWLGGVKDLPKAIDVVLSRLVQDQMIVREDNGFAAKFVGRNFVGQELPKSG